MNSDQFFIVNASLGPHHELHKRLMYRYQQKLNEWVRTCSHCCWCRHEKLRCRYSDIAEGERGNHCIHAHSSDELDEWKQRYQWRQMKKQMARERHLYSYMDTLVDDIAAAAVAGHSPVVGVRHHGWLTITNTAHVDVASRLFNNGLILSCLIVTNIPSVLWRCWLCGRKGVRPVKNWVVGCWRGYLSGARCRLAYGPAHATATHCLLLQ